MVSFSKICVNIQCYDHQIIYQKCTRCHQIACTFSKILGVTPPTPQGLAEARSAHCIKRSNKTRKGPKFGSSSPIIFSFLRHWRVMMFFAYGEGHEHFHLWWGPWTFVIFNGEGHELQYCHLPTFRGPPGALNNDRSPSTIHPVTLGPDLDLGKKSKFSDLFENASKFEIISQGVNPENLVKKFPTVQKL